MSDGRIGMRREGPVAIVTIDNQAKLNAIDLPMWQAMAEIFEQLNVDPEVRLMVLQGAGKKAFASGANITRFEGERADPKSVAHYREVTDRAHAALKSFPKPTIAVIRGFCIGGGLALALSCDLRLAEERARFAIPAGRLGLGYGFGGVERLTQLVGPSRAMEIFYTARQFSSAEALSMGLINQVQPDPLFDRLVEDYMVRIGANAPLTLQAVKAASIEIAKPQSERDAARAEVLAQACFESEDYAEGRQAFVEKREPVFKGR